MCLTAVTSTWWIVLAKGGLLVQVNEDTVQIDQKTRQEETADLFCDLHRICWRQLST